MPIIRPTRRPPSRIRITPAGFSRTTFSANSFLARNWPDGTPVAGQQYEYGFDDIGNRKFAASGGDQWGANLGYENYSPNNLNQYAQRTVPGAIDILGAVNSNATITVNNRATYRKGEYFRNEFSVLNGAA